MLLSDDDPAPFEVLNPDGDSVFVLTADHAGRAIPAGLGGLGVPASEMERHIAWDIGIAGVTRHMARLLDAPAIFQAYSRLVIDCNRDPSWPSAMPEISEHTPIPGNVGLTDAQRAQRVAAIFAPYHARITELLDARAGRRTIYVAMHSFTPSFKGESRSMEVGMLYGRDDRLATIMLDLLRQEGDLTVGDNAPYAVSDDSDYGIPVHGERRGLAHVEVEIRQDLIASVPGQLAWAERMARLLTVASGLLKD